MFKLLSTGSESDIVCFRKPVAPLSKGKPLAGPFKQALAFPCHVHVKLLMVLMNKAPSHPYSAASRGDAACVPWLLAGS